MARAFGMAQGAQEQGSVPGVCPHRSLPELGRAYKMGSTMDSFERIRKELQLPETKVRRLWSGPFKLAAASVALLLSLAGGYFMLRDVKTEEPVQIVESVIEQGVDKATLTLDNGEEVELGKGSSYTTTYANSDGEEIVYGGHGDKRELAFNYLTI